MARRHEHDDDFLNFNGDVEKYPDYRVRALAVYAEAADDKRHIVAPVFHPKAER